MLTQMGSKQRLISLYYLVCRTLLDGCPCGVERIDDAVLLLVHLHLRGPAHLDHRHTARQLGQALLHITQLDNMKHTSAK